MVFDIRVNENFEVEIDHTGDLSTVDGYAGLEQAIMLRLTSRFDDVVEIADRNNIVELARVEIKRVAESMDLIDEVSSIEIEFSDSTPETLLIDIIYDTGDISSLEVEP